MSIDWSIEWNEKSPGEGELLALVQAYVSGAGDVYEKRCGWIMVILPGKPSRALPPSLDWMRQHIPVLDRERMVEVWQDNKMGGVEVMVRMTDEFTMAVAAGLAEVIARVWGARLTRPS